MITGIVFLARSAYKRGVTVPIERIHVGATVEEHLGDFEVSVEGSSVEWGFGEIVVMFSVLVEGVSDVDSRLGEEEFYCGLLG